MYLLNALSLQLAQQLFINVARYRCGQNLVGAIDGSNTTFYTPGLEQFMHNLPFFDISVIYNGSRLKLLDDYTVAESLGFGAGFDTVILTVAPLPGDHLFADYILR